MKTNCSYCPRGCRANKLMDEPGFCQVGAGLPVSSVCIHRGEEPVLSGTRGICNVFFSRCNLKCIYCQNFQISSNHPGLNPCTYSVDELLAEVEKILPETENIVGLVSPSHCFPAAGELIKRLKSLPSNPTVVYNSNGFDSVEILRELEGLVDVYLPDFKYADPVLSQEYSGRADYPGVALAAIREMYRQKGSTLIIDHSGIARSGLIIRHLVLPGQVENSIKVLETIANELSTRVHISLMSQYYPTPGVLNHPLLGRVLMPDEFERVARSFHDMGFSRGWVQELSSHACYRPDFDNTHPFE